MHKNEKTKKKILKLIIIVFVIIAIVFIGIRFLNNNKDENNLSTEQKQTDIDLDGNNEYTIAASSTFNSEKSTTLETEEYVYSFIFLLKDDNVRLIMNKIQKASELSVNTPTIVNDIKVCDLNQDSKLEICINTLYWDKPEQYVFTYDKDSIDLVLYGDFTW